jgi:cytochrome c oxidase subunit II
MSNWRDRLAAVVVVAVVGAASVAFGVISMIDLVQKGARSTPGGQVHGVPIDFELNFQWPNAIFQKNIYSFHNLLLGVDIAICALVAGLILYAVWRYRASRHPVAARTTHNTVLEIAWTVIPVFILIVIAVPSFKLLDAYNAMPATTTTLKVTGHQWYWEYSYPDNGKIDLTSTIVSEDKLKAGDKNMRLLDVDTYAMLPVDTNVLIIVTSGDVIHSFMVPSLGVQKYAVPGRLNEIWVHATREGTYYGQCSQICGANHAFMPIGIKVVSKDAFASWVKSQQPQNVSSK